MTLLAPWLAVAGLCAIAIPIAIHLLLRLRRRPVQWAAMRLLREAMRETARRRRLEHLLVLALRCLLVALIGLALAQPLLRGRGAAETAGGRVIFFVIDDSLVSSIRADPSDPGRTALTASADRAVEIIRTLRPGDAVGVIAAARPVRGLLLPPTTDHAGVITLLSGMRPQETAADIGQGITLLSESIERLGADRSVAAYLMSDFRGGSADLAEALPEIAAPDVARRLRLIASPPGGAAIANVQVVGVEPLRSLLVPGASDGSGLVVVRLARSGPLDPAVTRVTLAGDFRTVAPRTVQWESGQSSASLDFVVDAADLETGALGMTASVDEDALPGDDRRHVVLQTRRQIRVALLDRRAFAVGPVERLSSGQWVMRALRPDERGPIEVTIEDPAALAPAALRGADAVIITRPDLLDDAGWAALRQRLSAGGLAVITPPEELNVHLWADRLPQELGLPWRVGIEPRDTPEGLSFDERQPGSPLLRLLGGELSELVRPVLVHRALSIDISGGGEPLLVGADGAALAVIGTPRDEQGRSLPGVVVLLGFAPDLTWSNLPTKPLMVPLFQELVRQGIGLAAEAQRLLVGESALAPVGAAELVRRDSEGAALSLDPTRPAPILRSGLYQMDDVAGQSIGLVAVNVDLAAAETAPLPPDGVLAWLRASGPWSFLDPGDPVAALRTIEAAAPISGALIILALLCAVAESILARRFSRADGRNRDGESTIAGGIPA